MSFLSIPANFVRTFLNKGHARSVNAKKNILSSVVIRGGSIVISLLLLPLTIHYVNPTQYGIWLTLSSILGWLGFFDIGFGNGLRNKLAEAIAKGEDGLARIYVSTTYAILAIIISFILIVFLCINPFLNWTKILNTSPALIGELRILVLIVFVFFCIQFVLQLITTILTANQQPARASLYNFLGSLLSLIIIFILTKLTQGNLLYLGIAFSVTPVLVLAVASVICFTGEYSSLRPSVKFVKFGYAKDLMGLGIKFFIIQISFVILYQTDNIIIAQLFGPAQVTPYNIVYKYFGVIPMIYGIILTPFWSAFTEAWIKKDTQWIKNTMKKLKLFWVLLSVVTFVMFLSSAFVYRVWVGKEVLIPLNLSAFMAVYVLINAWNGIYSQFLNGVGKVKIQLYAGVIGMIINIPLAFYLGKEIGICGVVLANAILGAINIIWGIPQYNKIINNRATGLWNQ